MPRRVFLVAHASLRTALSIPALGLLQLYRYETLKYGYALSKPADLMDGLSRCMKNRSIK